MKWLRGFIDIPIEIETENSNIYLSIKDIPVKHLPERPAPYCCDPSNPAYADPGDPEENEFEDLCVLEDEIKKQFEIEIDLLRIKLQQAIDNLDPGMIPKLLKSNIDYE